MNRVLFSAYLFLLLLNSAFGSNNRTDTITNLLPADYMQYSGKAASKTVSLSAFRQACFAFSKAGADVESANWRVQEAQSPDEGKIIPIGILDSEEPMLFMACPIKDYTYNGENVGFVINTNSYIAGESGNVDYYILKTSDERTIRFGKGEIVTPGFYREGKEILELEAFYTDGSMKKSRFAFNIRGTRAPDPDITWDVSADIPYQGEYGEGEVYVYLGEGNTEIRKPLIVIEGFDLDNSMNWEELYDMLNQENLIEDLKADGWDVIALNFDEGVDYMERNAYVVIRLIQMVNEQTGLITQPVLSGASMGGVVSRYALMYMENNDMNHNIATFISFDSPQQGANIPLGIQYWVMFYAPLAEEASFLLSRLDSPAAKQLLSLHYTTVPSEDTEPDPMHTEFYSTLDEMGGYPSIPRLVGIANGSGAQQGQGFEAGEQLMHYEFVSGLVSLLGDVWAVPTIEQSDIFQGYIQMLFPPYEDELTVAVNPGKPWDDAPGGYRATMAQLDSLDTGFGDIEAYYPNHSFIPTISALDLDTEDLYFDIAGEDDIYSLTPFDMIYYPEENEDHIFISVGTYNILMEELSLITAIKAKYTSAGDTDGLKLEISPNPFNPATVISYNIARPGKIELSIYNLKGRLVRNLAAGHKDAGHYSVVWDGKSNNGMKLSGGIYFCRISCGSSSVTKKIALMK